MFCSDRQLNLLRPTQFCDLLSLMHVAYYFIYQEIPCTKFAEKLIKEGQSRYLYKPNEFKKLRLMHKKRFEMEICHKNNPFNALTHHIIELREQFLLENLNEQKRKLTGSSSSNENDKIVVSSNSSKQKSTINYNYMVSLVPENLGINKKTKIHHKIHNSLRRCATLIKNCEKDRLENPTQQLLQSNLSEIQSQSQKEYSSLSGFQVPGSKQYNADECFTDMKSNQIDH